MTKTASSTNFDELLDRAATWGITPDPDLTLKIEQTQEALEALRSIREATQKDINKMRQDRSELIRTMIRGIVTGEGSTFGEPESVCLAQSPCFIGALEDLVAEMDRELEKQLARLARLEERRAEALKILIAVAERDARVRCRDFVRHGHGSRPVLEGCPDEVRLVCQSCQQVISKVDTSKLAGGLTAEAFTDASGHPIFDGNGNYRKWRCPACRLEPIPNPEWILTDSWKFYPVDPQRKALGTKVQQKLRRTA